MSYLILCSFEVGGLPFKMAEVLNRHGVETYYVSLQPSVTDHNSARFHYGSSDEKWDLSPLFTTYLNSSKDILACLRKIKKEFRITNALATGNKAYLLNKAGIRYSYWCYGADLDQDCFSPAWSINYPLWKKWLTSIKFACGTRLMQRSSICNSESAYISPYQWEALSRVCPGKNLFYFVHLLEVPRRDHLKKLKIESRNRICERIKAQEFFFSAARHVWTSPYRQLSDNKGNDVALQAFARYLMQYDGNVKLVLPQKGADVAASKALIRELGIEQNVHWIEEVSRTELTSYYQGASLCFGQFGTPVLSYAVLEPLAQGTVCVSFHENHAPEVPFYNEAPPLINSRDPAEIAERIHQIMSNSACRSELGLKSWQWAKDNCSEEAFVGVFQKIFS